MTFAQVFCVAIAFFAILVYYVPISTILPVSSGRTVIKVRGYIYMTDTLRPDTHQDPGESPENLILALERQRAAGEISTDEYLQAVTAIAQRGTSTPTNPPEDGEATTYPASNDSAEGWQPVPATNGGDQVQASPNDQEITQTQKPRLSRRGLLIGAGIVGAAGVGGIVANSLFASAGKPSSSQSSSEDTPTGASTSDTQQPSTPNTEPVPEKKSQWDKAQDILSEDTATFNTLPLSYRQLAIDGKFCDLVGNYSDPRGRLAYPYMADRKNPYTKTDKKFAGGEDKDLIEFDPAYIAESSDNKEATAQDILNQLTFAKAAAWGQVKEPMSMRLDRNTAANMVSGYFYEPQSDQAKAMIAEIMDSSAIKIFDSKSYVGAADIISSSELLVHTFDEHGRLEYKVINYSDGNGRRYQIVTPVETEFTGPDIGGSGEIKTYNITKWLVLREGEGTENTQGHLKHLS